MPSLPTPEFGGASWQDITAFRSPVEPAERQRRRLARRRARRSAADALGAYDPALARGLVGGQTVGPELERHLRGTGAVVVHGVAFPACGDVDHLIVGHGGITVVDTKSWTGDVTVKRGLPRLGVWLKVKEAENVTRQCAGVRLALLHARPDLRGTHIQGVMCLAAEPDRRVDHLRQGVFLCGSAGAAAIGARAGSLTAAEVEHLRDVLVLHMPRVQRADVDALT